MPLVLTQQVVAAARQRMDQDALAEGEPYIVLPEMDPPPVPPAQLTIGPTTMAAGVAGERRLESARRLRAALASRGRQ